MTFYRYDQSSPIDAVIVRKSSGGRVRTMLIASDTMSLEQVVHIKKIMTDNGWQYVVSEADGKPCLEVCGVKNIDQIETVLRRTHMVHGPRTVNEKDNPHYTLMDKLRHNRLKLYGVLSVIADAGMVFYGHMKKKLPDHKHDWEDTAAAAAYASGSASFLLFGAGDKTDHQLQAVSLQLKHKMEIDGISTPVQSTLESFVIAAKNASDYQKKMNFFSNHPAELGNGLTALAGAFIAKGALKSKNIQDGILGSVTLASGSAAALINEKPNDPNAEAPKGAWQKAKHWVQERPNRIAGYGYMVSTLMHAGESMNVLWNVAKGKKYEHNRTTALWAYSGRAFFSALTIISEIILTAASKGGERIPTHENALEQSIYSMVADVILAQPEADRDRLIADFSKNFIARPDVLGGNPVQIKAALAERVHSLPHNPWSSFAKLQAEPAVDVATRTPGKAVERVVAQRAAAAQATDTPSMAF